MSPDFPTANPFQPVNSGQDVFVTKLNTSGSALLYSTYLGGGANERGNGIAVDAAGNAYITGWTTSLDFPTAYPFQGTCAGGCTSSDAFVTQLNASGSTLVYSSYLGGTSMFGGILDVGNAIAVDAAGNAYLTGYTNSTNFPTAHPFQPNNRGQDAFVTKVAFDPATQTMSLVYSSYLGGDLSDIGNGIAVDATGNAYLTGQASTSGNFPIANPFQPQPGGLQDAFVTKVAFDPATLTMSLVYSSFFGGNNADRGNAIAVDADRNVYFTGWTTSDGFPTLHPFQAEFGGGTFEVYVAKLRADGSALVYSS